MVRIFIALMILGIGLSGCASAPPSAAGLYGPKLIKQQLKISSAQYTDTRVVNFTRQEVFEAANTALLRIGYQTDYQSPNQDMIAGSGEYPGCGSRPRVTMAIYMEQLDTKPTTRFDILLDRYSLACVGIISSAAANDIANEMQKVLATY